MGAGKGGADFDPKGRSEGEVMRFCQSFMTELQRHIGQFTDVPAGDIGVGGREIGYLFGQYKRIRNEFTGVLTGKGLDWGGSLIRPEATGYGAVYFAEEMAKTRDESLEDKTCLVSGAGNVAQYTVEKLLDLGRKPVTLSDSGGFIYDKDGIDREKLAYVMDLKNGRRGRIMEYAEQYPGVDVHRRSTPSHALQPALGDPRRVLRSRARRRTRSTPRTRRNLLARRRLRRRRRARTCRPCPTGDRGGSSTRGSSTAREGGERRRRGGERPRDGAELERAALDAARPSTSGCTRIMVGDPHDTCRSTAEEYDVARQLRARREHRGFRKVADAMLAQGVVRASARSAGTVRRSKEVQDRPAICRTSSSGGERPVARRVAVAPRAARRAPRA